MGVMRIDRRTFLKVSAAGFAVAATNLLPAPGAEAEAETFPTLDLGPLRDHEQYVFSCYVKGVTVWPIRLDDDRLAEISEPSDEKYPVVEVHEQQGDWFRICVFGTGRNIKRRINLVFQTLGADNKFVATWLQLEEGPFPTRYIETHHYPVTRAEDRAWLPAGFNPDRVRIDPDCRIYQRYGPTDFETSGCCITSKGLLLEESRTNRLLNSSRIIEHGLA